MLREKGLPAFEEALKMLDKKLESIRENIVIHAIGGFVMLYYGIDDHGYTIDIDTLTKRYDDKVIEAIAEVGKELGMEKDWLNNDCATLPGFLKELDANIKWEKAKYSLNNIELYVADYIGMIRVKAKAVHDGGLVPRKTDTTDMLLLLKTNNINDIEELDNDKRLCFIKNKYNRAYKFLAEMKDW